MNLKEKNFKNPWQYILNCFQCAMEHIWREKTTQIKKIKELLKWVIITLTFLLGEKDLTKWFLRKK